MGSKQSVHLGSVPETLMVPLFARAIENRRKRPILVDARAAEIVESIDWDFERFNQRARVIACTLRGAMFDEWVKDFIRIHPEGTVIEIGCGLNTRFERLDNGRLHWIDLDLPEVIELRREFFTDSERHAAVAASVLDTGWIESVRRSPAPYFFVAEAVLLYLQEPEVKAALAQIAQNFPSATIAFDTLSRKALQSGNKDHARQKLTARFAWACNDPNEIEGWKIGLRRVESAAIGDIPEPLKPKVALSLRTALCVLRKLFRKQMKAYQLNLFVVRSP
jgi:O-methyltransferase involved in polyketide biosynthesis